MQKVTKLYSKANSCFSRHAKVYFMAKFAQNVLFGS